MTDTLELIGVEKEIQKILKNICEEWYVHKTLKGDRNWTNRIKDLLGDLGHSYGYEICTGGNEKFHGEWLYDMVWYKNDNLGLLDSVALVVESEWNRRLKDIQYDFEKLLVSNSEHRLMICQSNTDNIYQLKQYFYDAVNSYKLINKGSRFLIAILDDLHTGEFQFELIIKQ